MLTTVALVGAGYRSHTFARVIAAVPDRLRLAGAVVRDPERASEFAAEHGTTTWGSVAEADLDGVDVVVVAVPGSSSATVIAELKDRGPVVLAETPPGVDVAQLDALCALERDGLRIQVAEQYHLEPLIAAQISIARSGLLGTVSQAQVAVAHGYHGVSVLRRALGIAFEDAEITATRIPSPVRLGPSRYGDPDEETMVTETYRTLAWLDFGDRHGTFDFDDQQYRNWARSPGMLIRGTDGELRDTEVRRFLDPRTPLVSRLERVAAGGPGNHEGMFLRGYTFEGTWRYANPYLRARLAEDEIAIASILEATGEYARGGPTPYPLAEAAQDRYLDLAIQRAAETGEKVRTSRQSWAG